MRTPGQFQQNYPRELAINEAAALAGVDAIQFRIDNTKDERAIGALKAVRVASDWDSRPSPRPDAATTGTTAVRGRGVSLMLRDGTYWACVSQIAVTPATGAIKVEKCILAVDPGVVVNPNQLKRQVEGGAMMGVSIALFEEVMMDESGILQNDWNSYPILTMADMPEIKVELIHNPKVGTLRRRLGGSQCAGRSGHCSRLQRRNRKSNSEAADEARLCAGCFEGVRQQKPIGGVPVRMGNPVGMAKWMG